MKSSAQPLTNSGEHPQALIAEGALGIGGAAGDVDRGPGQRQGRRVGEHVAGVGDQARANLRQHCRRQIRLRMNAAVSANAMPRIRPLAPAVCGRSRLAVAVDLSTLVVAA